MLDFRSDPLSRERISGSGSALKSSGSEILLAGIELSLWFCINNKPLLILYVMNIYTNIIINKKEEKKSFCCCCCSHVSIERFEESLKFFWHQLNWFRFTHHRRTICWPTYILEFRPNYYLTIEYWHGKVHGFLYTVQVYSLLLFVIDH